MSRRATSERYEVGYRKPPKATQFKQGQSGNPHGRPKGTKNLKTDLIEELGEHITLSEGGKPKRLSKQRALVKSLTAKAIKGDARAMSTVLNLMLRILDVAASDVAEVPLSEEERAILINFEKRILERGQRGALKKPRENKTKGDAKMYNPTRELLNASLRNDYASFAERAFQTVNPGTEFLANWHQQAIAHHLEQCRQRKIKRLMITMPPRSGKSHWTSVAYPAFLLGHDPTVRIINATYGHDLTAQFARQFRLVVNSPWYQEIFPGLCVAKDTETEFVTTMGGCRFGTSVGGTLTGRGGNVILIDDPMKPDDAMSKRERDRTLSWYKGTLSTRLDDKLNDVLIFVMQRLHEDDLVGYLLETEPELWTHLDLPAIAEEPQSVPVGRRRVHKRKAGDVLHPEREPREVLEQQKKTMGSMAFSAQYQQRPVPTEGNLVKREWFQTYTVLPEKKPSDRIVQSWDTAAKPGQLNDFSVCTTWLVRKSDYYLMEVFRGRLSYPDLKKRAIGLAKRHEAGPVLIEDAGHGTALIQELRREGDLHPIRIKPEGDKVTRMSAQSAKFEAGQVWLPHSAPWLEEFIAELLAFPGGRHDDQVDSVSQFLGWIARQQTRKDAVGGCLLFTRDEAHPDGGHWVGPSKWLPQVNTDPKPSSLEGGMCVVGDSYPGDFGLIHPGW